MDEDELKRRWNPDGDMMLIRGSDGLLHRCMLFGLSMTVLDLQWSTQVVARMQKSNDPGEGLGGGLSKLLQRG